MLYNNNTLLNLIIESRDDEINYLKEVLKIEKEANNNLRKEFSEAMEFMRNLQKEEIKELEGKYEN